MILILSMWVEQFRILGGSISYGIATIKYDSSGNQKWVVRYDNPIIGLSSEAVKIKENGKSNLIVLGQIQGNTSGWDIIVINYSNLVGIHQTSSVVPNTFKLYQNFPNPFNSETVIKYEIPIKSNIKMQLYDRIGKEVIEIIKQEQLPGEYEVKLNSSNLPSGIYFYRLISNGKSIDTKKLILIK